MSVDWKKRAPVLTPSVDLEVDLGRPLTNLLPSGYTTMSMGTRPVDGFDSGKTEYTVTVGYPFFLTVERGSVYVHRGDLFVVEAVTNTLTVGEASTTLLCKRVDGASADANSTLGILRKHLEAYTDTSMPTISALLSTAAAEIDKIHDKALQLIKSYSPTPGAEEEEEAFGHLGVYSLSDTKCSVDTCEKTSTYQLVTGAVTHFFCENHYYDVIKDGRF